MRFPDLNGHSRAFSEALVDFGAAGGWQPKHMLRMMCSESGLVSTTVNSIGAAGLTQLLPSTQRNLGYNAAARGPYERQPAEVQLGYTARYYGEWRARFAIPEFRSSGHLYQCNFMPATLAGEFDEQEVVLSRLRWGKGYDQNRALDINRDGLITVAELEEHTARATALCQRRYDVAMQSVAAVLGERHASLPGEAPEAMPGTIDLLLTDGVQRALAILRDRISRRPYFEHAVTGFYGQVTRRAVGGFQRDHGLTIDGWVGKATRPALQAALQAEGVPSTC